MPISREQILNLPDAPVGERLCEHTEEQAAAQEVFLSIMQIYQESIGQLTPRLNNRQPSKGKDWRIALEVLKATGLSIAEYKRLSMPDKIMVIREAGDIKREQTEAAVKEPVPPRKPCISGRMVTFSNHRTESLTEPQAEVLTAIARYGRLNKTDLVKKSGTPDAVEVLRRMQEKSRFAELGIETPKSTGRPGYYAQIEPASPH